MGRAVNWSEVQYQAFLKRHKNKHLKVAAEKAKKVVITDGYTSNFRGWVTIGGKRCHFKSLSEVNYAYYLEWLKSKKQILDWEYEPETFVFPKDDYKTGPFYYKPDFKVLISKKKKEWHEVKGHMNPASRKKIKRFNKHHGKREGNIVLIDATWFSSVGKTLSSLVPGWQSLKQLQRQRGY